MKHFDGTPPMGAASFLSPELQVFLQGLQAAPTSEAVWTLLSDLARHMDLPVVDYVQCADNRQWDPLQIVQSTVPPAICNRLDPHPAARFAHVTPAAGNHPLIPQVLGVASLPEPALAPTELQLHAARLARIGITSGASFPLPASEPGYSAQITFGGAQDRADFEELLTRHGATLHNAALAGHMRFSLLYRQEFAKRVQLTVKQVELLNLVGNGLMDKQIAYHLSISFSAVRQRLVAVQKKTGARNRAHLAALAMRIGLSEDPAQQPARDMATAAE